MPSDNNYKLTIESFRDAAAFIIDEILKSEEKLQKLAESEDGSWIDSDWAGSFFELDTKYSSSSTFTSTSLPGHLKVYKLQYIHIKSIVIIIPMMKILIMLISILITIIIIIIIMLIIMISI